jgi:hypothetical protein
MHISLLPYKLPSPKWAKTKETMNKTAILLPHFRNIGRIQATGAKKTKNA